MPLTEAPVSIEERTLLYHLATANQKESTESYLRKRFGDEILDKLHKERLIGREPKGIYYITLRGKEVAGKIPPKGANLYAEAKKILEEGLEVKPPAIPKASVTPEVTRVSPTYENLTEGQILVDQAGDRWLVTGIKKEGVPGRWAYTIKGETIDLTRTRPLGEIERYYKMEQPAIPKAAPVTPSLFELYNTQYSLKQLQEMAKTAGLSPSGLKQDLINRLAQKGMLK